MMTTTTLMAQLAGRSEEAVRMYFKRNKLSLNDPIEVLRYVMENGRKPMPPVSVDSPKGGTSRPLVPPPPTSPDLFLGQRIEGKCSKCGDLTTDKVKHATLGQVFYCKTCQQEGT